MSYNIYYMYDITTGLGYIGQNTDDNDDKRILDHYESALKPKKNKKGKDLYDGGAEVINHASNLSNVRYKFFKDSTYGISENVYNLFLQEWSPRPGEQVVWADLTPDEKLDLAEIMHNMWAHLQGREWNAYNRLIGGMSYTKKNPRGIKNLTYHFSEEVLKELADLYKDSNLEQPSDYTVHRFSFRQTHLDNKGITKNDFAKLMYPLQHVVTKQLITDRFKKIIADYLNTYFRDIFEANEDSRLGKELRKNLKKVVSDEVFKTFLDPGMYQSMLGELSTTKPKVNVKTSGYSAAGHTTNKSFVKDLIKALKVSKRKENLDNLCKKLNNTINRISHAVDVKWDYTINRETMASWVNTIIDKIGSNLSIKKISDMFNYNYGKFHIVLDDIFPSTIPTQLHVQITEKRSTMPKWAVELKKEQLLSNWQSANNGKLKILICEEVCSNLFSQIKDEIIPSVYDSTTTLQQRLYNSLSAEDWIKSGYSWDFCRSIIEIWHEYTYGPDAWIQMKEVKTIDIPQDESYKKYWFARRDIVESLSTNPSFTIHWYKGTFYESSGVEKGSLSSAAEILAKVWKW